jgi:hypothetical protein
MKRQTFFRSRPVISRPYIPHGAYWYGSGYFRDNGWSSVPYRPLTRHSLTGASP